MLKEIGYLVFISNLHVQTQVSRGLSHCGTHASRENSMVSDRLSSFYNELPRPDTGKSRGLPQAGAQASRENILWATGYLVSIFNLYVHAQVCHVVCPMLDYRPVERTYGERQVV